ncbi:non-structural maintenance of chromosomes element 1 homolog [Leptopilina heterotoma]|uniref:non-structural maintenance of chromosomes element 1 homolog n=1 Tax=Leptopilina heterotoma TaxID=63436 RepID=UPI001CA8B262|nr:non-structural maintenance of chromosomes element 1 homolog [Leptopilina heterotoma]
MEYSKKHKAFLQVFLQNGIISAHEARGIAVKIFDNTDTVDSHALLINIQLQIVNMALKSVKCEHTGEEFWVLVSTILDDSTKFQQEYTHAQLELLRKIYAEIITSATKSVSGTDCLNFCTTLENRLSKHDGEDFLNEMIAKQWLYCSNGIFYMGARSIAEQLLYFKSTYDDALANCVLCKQVIFYGHTCQECNHIIHNHCLFNYARIQKPLKCPQCSKPMPDVEIEDTQDVTNDDSMEVSQDQTQNVSQTKKKRSRRH